jgi:aminopeptidase N
VCFRRITPYIDRPDVLSRYRVTIEGDAARLPVLLSNGNRLSETVKNGRKTVVYDDPNPKPCYLFALVGGDLLRLQDSFTNMHGRKVDLSIWCEKGHEDKLKHAMDSLKNAMRWDETEYGLSYDLDSFNVVAVDDFNAGAMENTSLNIFNAKYVLANPETATDSDYLGIESVIAHEYFHHWSGNLVTVQNWFELSLKEGFTVFRDQEFSADMNSRAVQRIAEVQTLRAVQFPEDSGPTAHPVRAESYIAVDNFYTTTVYQKGAEIIRMMAVLLGPKAYRKGTDLYFARHKGQAVAIENFVKAMEDGSGRDLSAFRNWYDQAGTPKLEAKGDWDAATGTWRLTLTQSMRPTKGQAIKQPVPIPVKMALLDRNGREMPANLGGVTKSEFVLEFGKHSQVFEFTGLSEPPTPSLLRGFSAAVVLDYPYSNADLRLLMSKDSDLFTRWEAGQELATRVLLDLVKTRQAGRPMRLSRDLQAAVASLLDDPGLDPAFVAKALVLPSENELAQKLEPVDVDAIQAARRFVEAELGRRLKTRFAAAYARSDSSAPYKPEPKEMARRALKNAALSYLVAGGDPGWAAKAAEQFRVADNMTERFAAMAVLSRVSGPERTQVLEAFVRSYQDDKLLMDKWFSVQASAPRHDVVGDVRALMRRPDFSLKAPNRMRALLGGFISNHAGFHAADGSGYRLIANSVLACDAINPRTAAGLLRGFRQWRRYDPARQALMKAELERIKAHPGLSPNVFEVVDACLAPPPDSPSGAGPAATPKLPS